MANSLSTTYYSFHTILFSSRSRYFQLDLDVTISNLDAGYIYRLMQIDSGYFLDVRIQRRTIRAMSSSEK